MNSAIERLISLKVRDVMSQRAVHVSADQTLEEAAAVLQQHRITGAPVVDTQGKCIGVISSSDFVRKESPESSPETPAQVLATLDRSSHLVEAHMTPDVRTLDSESPMLTAARLLCSEHIHRIVVVDDTDRPIGVATSLDIVAAMLLAIEE